MIRALLTFLVIALPMYASAAEMRLVQGAVPGINYITVLGTFEIGDDQKFIQIALPLDNAIVAFNSDGGNLLAGLGIGRAIRLKEFTTLVPKNSICASACGLAWLGGFERLVDEGAQVGFHAASITNNGATHETGMGNALAGAYLRRRTTGATSPGEVCAISSVVGTKARFGFGEGEYGVGVWMEATSARPYKAHYPDELSDAGKRR